MSVLPRNDRDLIDFCEFHVSVWQAAPSTVGLTAAQVTALNNLTTAARTAYDDAQAARMASKASTTLLKSAVSPMREQAADLVRQIKAYAALQPNPGTVYAQAQIPEPTPPSPAQAPGTPNNITVTLEPSGAVTLSWDANNAAASSGGFFNVMRKLPGQSGFVQVGGSSGSTSISRRMKFTDYTVPTSAAGAGAQYIIQGQRGDKIGEASEAITVQFGVESGSGFSGTFSVGGVSSPMKIAA